MREDLRLDIQSVEFPVDRREIDRLAVSGPGLPVPEASGRRVGGLGACICLEVIRPDAVHLVPLRRVFRSAISIDLALLGNDDFPAQRISRPPGDPWNELLHPAVAVVEKHDVARGVGQTDQEIGPWCVGQRDDALVLRHHATGK